MVAFAGGNMDEMLKSLSELSMLHWSSGLYSKWLSGSLGWCFKVVGKGVATMRDGKKYDEGGSKN